MLLDERVKREKFELKNQAKLYNTLRVKKALDYKISKIKEKILENDERSQKNIDRMNQIKQMRLKNM